jgi:hypothetical protein
MPLIWGAMGSEIFLPEGLDRANHIELLDEFRFGEQRSAAMNPATPPLLPG